MGCTQDRGRERERDRQRQRETVAIRGATGLPTYLIDGVYEPTEELHDGRAVYRKQDGQRWIEYHAVTAGGKKHVWMVKPTASRGKSEGYMRSTAACEAAVTVEQVPGWDVHDGSTWAAQASVSVQRVPIAVEESQTQTQ